MIKQISGGFACAVACSAFMAVTAASAAGPAIGFAEDATKYAPDGGSALFAEMNKLGTTSNRVAVFWNADAPTTIEDEPFLDRMIPAAEAHGIQIVFAIYPKRAMMAPTTPEAADAFCDFAVSALRAYPSVRKVVIGNEPNQPRFWRPIWHGGKPASPAAMEVVLASCYDKIKAYDPSIDVIGVGLSPRGNDKPYATSNSSISPVRWIEALGDAYRSSGRTAPLFDEWSWHCYPNVNTDTVAQGYPWPDTGCVNADRVKQAIWDAFNGTGQPTFEESGVWLPAATGDFGATLFGTLKMFVDETGWQVDTHGRPGYTNAENVPPISEATQARAYAQLVHLADCEPTLTAFHFFHEIDEVDRLGFQSGPLRTTAEERHSAAAIQQAIAADDGSCTGTLTSWSHATAVLGAGAAIQLHRGRLYLALNANEGFAYTATFTKKLGNGRKSIASTTSHGDGPLAVARATGSRSTVMTATRRGAAPLTVVSMKVPAGFAGGRVTIKLSAETNSARTASQTLKLTAG